jgi:hypothetical protein
MPRSLSFDKVVGNDLSVCCPLRRHAAAPGTFRRLQQEEFAIIADAHGYVSTRKRWSRISRFELAGIR